MIRVERNRGSGCPVDGTHRMSVNSMDDGDFCELCERTFYSSVFNRNSLIAKKAYQKGNASIFSLNAQIMIIVIK